MIVLADSLDAEAEAVARVLGARVLTSASSVAALADGTRVFNLSRSAEVAGMLEVLDLPFTGVSAAGLLCCANAATMDAIVRGAGIGVGAGPARRSVAVIGRPTDPLSRAVSRELRLDGYCRLDYSAGGLFLRADPRPPLRELASLAGTDFEPLVRRIARAATSSRRLR